MRLGETLLFVFTSTIYFNENVFTFLKLWSENWNKSIKYILLSFTLYIIWYRSKFISMFFCLYLPLFTDDYTAIHVLSQRLHLFYLFDWYWNIFLYCLIIKIMFIFDIHGIFLSLGMNMEKLVVMPLLNYLRVHRDWKPLTWSSSLINNLSYVRRASTWHVVVSAMLTHTHVNKNASFLNIEITKLMSRINV